MKLLCPDCKADQPEFFEVESLDGTVQRYVVVNKWTVGGE